MIVFFFEAENYLNAGHDSCSFLDTNNAVLNVTLPAYFDHPIKSFWFSATSLYS